jgi:hypothetical protein
MTLDLLIRAAAYLAIGLAIVDPIRWVARKAGHVRLFDEPDSVGFTVLFWPLVLILGAIPLIGQAARRMDHATEDTPR